jgi:hypothetical protein
MQVCQRICQLARPIQDLSFREKATFLASLVDQCAQVFTWHKIHYQVIATANREEIRDFWEVRMVQASQNSGFSLELVASLLQQISRQAAVMFDFFKRALAPFQAQIIGKVNTSHPP